MSSGQLRTAASGKSPAPRTMPNGLACLVPVWSASAMSGVGPTRTPSAQAKRSTTNVSPHPHGRADAVGGGRREPADDQDLGPVIHGLLPCSLDRLRESHAGRDREVQVGREVPVRGDAAGRRAPGRRWPRGEDPESFAPRAQRAGRLVRASAGGRAVDAEEAADRDHGARWRAGSCLEDPADVGHGQTPELLRRHRVVRVGHDGGLRSRGWTRWLAEWAARRSGMRAGSVARAVGRARRRR